MCFRFGYYSILQHFDLVVVYHQACISSIFFCYYPRSIEQGSASSLIKVKRFLRGIRRAAELHQVISTNL